jgi:hypothetical protein
MSKRPIRKLFLDSRFAHTRNDEGSAFTINLTESVELPEDYGMVLSSLVVPHSWLNVAANRNNIFWLLETDGATTWRRGVKVPEADYDLAGLAAALQAVLNASSNGPIYTVAGNGLGGLQITSANGSFKVPLPQELGDPTWRINVWLPATAGLGDYTDYGQGRTYALNDMISSREIDDLLQPGYTSGVVNLQPLHAIYVHSNLTTNSTLDSIGRRSIIAKIPVTTAYGFTEVYRTSGFAEDAIYVGGLRFSNVRIELRDVWGNYIDLRGMHVSCELSFAPLM